MGDHSYAAEEYPPGTVFSPTGEPVGPGSDTSIPDESGQADQDPHFEESEDLEPDASLADPAVDAVE